MSIWTNASCLKSTRMQQGVMSCRICLYSSILTLCFKLIRWWTVENVRIVWTLTVYEKRGPNVFNMCGVQYVCRNDLHYWKMISAQNPFRLTVFCSWKSFFYVLHGHVCLLVCMSTYVWCSALDSKNGKVYLWSSSGRSLKICVCGYIILMHDFICLFIS